MDYFNDLRATFLDLVNTLLSMEGQRELTGCIFLINKNHIDIKKIYKLK